MRLMRSILLRSFGWPQGILGRLGGVIMARMNADCGTWVTHLLEIRPNDEVLEVGFGPRAHAILTETFDVTGPNGLAIRGCRGERVHCGRRHLGRCGGFGLPACTAEKHVFSRMRGDSGKRSPLQSWRRSMRWSA
jgi:hypothetical protein